jgi:hypothetical protein
MSNRNRGVAVITGASSGIGKVYADRFAKRGYDLLLVARRKDRLVALSSELQQNYGGKAEVLAADLAQDEDLKKVGAVLASNEHIAVLVNNAGTAAVGSSAELPIEKIEQLSRAEQNQASGAEKIKMNSNGIRSFATVLALACLAGQSGAQVKSATVNTAARIANAESAGPEAVSKHATILDWPARKGDEPVVLRKGSNGWTCFTDWPETPANDPMCLDDVWMEWMQAGMQKRPARIDRVGLAYMLQGGEAFDQRDPSFTSSPPGKKPYFVGPHVMVILPNPKELAGLSHDVYNGGPFVEALERDHPIILMPVALPGSKLKVVPGAIQP